MMETTKPRNHEAATATRGVHALFVASSFRRSVALLCIELTVCLSSAAGAEPAKPLGAGDLVLIFNTIVPESRELAQYYAQRRGVPADRLLGLRMPDRDAIERDGYPRVVRELRQALRDAGLQDRARCLVTFFGVPIRVGPVAAGPKEKELAAELGKEFDATLRQLVDQTTALEELAGQSATGAAATKPVSPGKQTQTDFKATAERYQRAKNAAAGRLEREKDEARRSELIERFFGIVERVEGSAGLIAQLRPREGEVHPLAMRRLETIRDLLKDSEAKIDELLRAPLDSSQRAEARQLIRQVHGLLAAASRLQDDRESLLGHETTAALDSELMLLWWDDYDLYRWQMNTLSWRVRSLPSLRIQVPADHWSRKVLMVSRLDGPSPAIVRRMIDDSIETERTGLKGRFYIDARGFAKDGSYGTYDQNLRDLANMMKARTKFPTVLDDRSALFGPGQCPETALYCGWYSLRKYVPAFTFVRGAVGYHIASSEAISLRGRNEQGWCKRMLDDGIAATLGPVAEPYLHAFPLPKDFFGLLLTGRFSLAEVYAYSDNLTSWMMMLLGDPLYRPFAAGPLLRLEDAVEPNVIPETYRPAATQPATTRE